MDTPQPIIIQTTPAISAEVMGILKTAITLLTVTLISILLVIEAQTIFKSFRIRLPSNDLKPILTTPYTPTAYPDFGIIPDPKLTLPVSGYHTSEEITFMLDSGAIVTSLPSSYVKKLGLNLESAKRIILNSLTTKTIIGYVMPVTFTFDSTDITIPVAFADVSTPVLGRYGFLDKYTIVFDHQQQTVTIAEKQKI